MLLLLGLHPPGKKLSNYLVQVHNLAPKERMKYLGLKRKFARAGDVKGRGKIVDKAQRKSKKLCDTWQKAQPDQPRFIT